MDERRKARPGRQGGPGCRRLCALIERIRRGGRRDQDAPAAADLPLDNGRVAGGGGKRRLRTCEWSDTTICPSRRCEQARLRKSAKRRNDGMPVVERIECMGAGRREFIQAAGKQVRAAFVNNVLVVALKLDPVAQE